MIKLSGNSIVVREYKDTDIAQLMLEVNDPQISQNTLKIPHPYTEDDAHFWIAHTQKEYSRDQRTSLPLAITLNDKLIGAVGLDNLQKNKAEVGYWLGKNHRGNNYVPEALNLLVDYTFKELKVARLYAKIFKGNAGSKRVLEKCGFKYEGTLEKDEVKNGQLIDVEVYAKINPQVNN